MAAPSETSGGSNETPRNEPPKNEDGPAKKEKQASIELTVKGQDGTEVVFKVGGCSIRGSLEYKRDFSKLVTAFKSYASFLGKGGRVAVLTEGQKIFDRRAPLSSMLLRGGTSDREQS
ncbi:small ubiquitin-related modifier [Klebsormidium nitens]|uniref:Small ubiquitin-related modifier n=1 Tax=Klebsormidium nitens TaxID=105231 RepID=A0A1Y1HP99_KLENI|nr:small ubiquitin-related modifier [Klebsormidium nitens]|eukprot:GAQ78801.1 small ubiquitin-related modifier [Klebsormidium nitens]